MIFFETIKQKLKNQIEIFGFRRNILMRELSRNCVPVNSYVWMNYDGSVDHSNWGDDINWFFLKEIVEGRLVPYDRSILTRLFKRKNYVVIGSTIDMIANENSVIWGAGIIDSKTSTLPQFREIRAVRGPKTRRKLIEMGYDCPEVYGDPALLVPLHYRPAVKKRYKLGIIPHFTELKDIQQQMGANPDVNLISIRDYKDWRSFVDEILSCEAIVSSSLHGLIVPEAYGIPNVWVVFQGAKKRDHFKYEDFYESIGKQESPVYLTDLNDLSEVERKLSEWQPAKIDLKPLIAAAPFKLKLKENNL